MAESEEYRSSYMWLDDLGPGHDGRGHDEKKRFSEEQVKSLELMFESQTKLEPQKKLQLANELGLHPRQVAIWFQNKRARWKSKQIERQYSSLKAEYDALLSKFESLKNENQALAKQLQKLAELLSKQAEERGQEEERPSLRSVEGSDNKEKEAELHAQPDVDRTLVRSEQELFFQHGWLPDKSSTTTSPWWEFWSMK